MARLRRTHSGALSLLALAGCDIVFQVEKVTPVERVTGSYLYKDIGVDGSVTLYPPAPGVIELRLAEPGGTSTTIDLSDDGKFAFDYPRGLRYRITVNGSETYPLEIVSSSSTLLLGSTSFGRRERAAVTKSTLLQYVTNAPVTGGLARFASRGHRAIIEANGVTPATSEWLDARPVDEIGASIGLLDAAVGDELYYLHHVLSPTNEYYRIANYIRTTPTMVDGQPVRLGTTADPAPVTPATLDRCVHIVAPMGREVARLDAIQGVDAAPSADWSVTSVPKRDAGGGGRLRLVFDAVPPTANTDTDVVYSSPFAGEMELAVMGVNHGRTLTAPGTTIGIRIFISTSVILPVDPTPNATTCANNRADLGAYRTPILDRINVGGTEVNADNQAVLLDRNALVRVLVTFDSVPPFDTVDFTLFEVADVENTTQLRLLRSIVTVDDFIDLDPVLFLRNRRYIFRVNTRRQLGAAATGNFRDQSLPIVQAARYSPMFLIAN